MNTKDFIDLIASSAQAFQQKKSIFASITISQAALETGWAKFIPRDKCNGKESYNFFGIKGQALPVRSVAIPRSLLPEK